MAHLLTLNELELPQVGPGMFGLNLFGGLEDRLLSFSCLADEYRQLGIYPTTEQLRIWHTLEWAESLLRQLKRSPVEVDLHQGIEVCWEKLCGIQTPYDFPTPPLADAPLATIRHAVQQLRSWALRNLDARHGVSDVLAAAKKALKAIWKARLAEVTTLASNEVSARYRREAREYENGAWWTVSSGYVLKSYDRGASFNRYFIDPVLEARSALWHLRNVSRLAELSQQKRSEVEHDLKTVEFVREIRQLASGFLHETDGRELIDWLAICSCESSDILSRFQFQRLKLLTIQLKKRARRKSSHHSSEESQACEIIPSPNGSPALHAGERLSLADHDPRVPTQPEARIMSRKWEKQFVGMSSLQRFVAVAMLPPLSRLVDLLIVVPENLQRSMDHEPEVLRILALPPNSWVGRGIFRPFAGRLVWDPVATLGR